MDFCPLPLEVVDLIVHELPRDSELATLKSCALVCKSWLPSSRTKLFRQLHLRPSGRASPQSWLALLSSAPHIAPYVKELEVLCERSSWISWDASLPPLLGRLQHVEEIALMGLDIPWLPEPLTSALHVLLRSPTIKRVRMRLCVLPASAAEFLGSKPLESIELSEVTIETPVEDDECSHPGLRPRRIEIEGKAIGGVVDWLVPSDSCELEELEKLSVRYQGDDPDAQEAVDRLLQCASNLKILDLCLYPATGSSQSSSDASALCSAPSIRYNHALRELRLSHFDMDATSPTNQLPWLRTLLARLTAQHVVRKIAIDARDRPAARRRPPVPMWKRLDTQGWAGVDDVLASVALCAVEVRIREPPSSVGKTRASILASMPALCARGLLRVIE